MRRGLAAVAAVVMVLAVAGSAQADEPSSQTLPSIVFPVVGPVSYHDTWGAARSDGRSHIGQDLMADKMQPLVAVVDGVVSRLTVPEPSYGYMLTITDDAGWQYHYIHLNNDTPGTDDGVAALEDVFGPGIVEGAGVVAGQLVAYVGDSGNAENVAPQLHFEMEDPNGQPVNPMPALDAAPRLETPVGETAPNLFPRLAGPDRVATAVEISRHGWEDGTADRVVLADGDRWDEALPAAPLAARYDAPLLLTRGEDVPTAVVEEIERLGTTEVVAVGSVATSGLGEGVTIRRVGTSGDAMTTAAAVASEIGGDNGLVVVSAKSFADAITGSSLAVAPVRPILYSRRDTVPQITVDSWRSLGEPVVTIVGGSGVVGDNIAAFLDADRVAGTDRYATSVAAADAAVDAGRSPDEVLLATGTGFADALAVAPLAREHDGIALLVDGAGTGNDGASLDWLAEAGDNVEVEIIGGAAAVSARAERSVGVAVQRA